MPGSMRPTRRHSSNWLDRCTAWMDSNDPAERKRLDAEIQAQAFQTVPFIPLGQYFLPYAYRTGLSGFVRAPITALWNVRRA